MTPNLSISQTVTLTLTLNPTIPITFHKLNLYHNPIRTQTLSNPHLNIRPPTLPGTPPTLPGTLISVYLVLQPPFPIYSHPFTY